MKFLTNERLSEHRYKTPEGYLVCTDAILARTGKQTYRKNEVFADSDDDSEIEIDRTPEEVFSEQTLASFENKPLTVEHPDEDVNVHNYKDYAVGFVRDVRRGIVDGQDVILGNLVITDEDTIKEVENGEHTELSCGYDCDITDDEHPCQKNIRGNHVALCEQGRAGIARIVDSNKVEDVEHIPTKLKNELKHYFGQISTFVPKSKRSWDMSDFVEEFERYFRIDGMPIKLIRQSIKGWYKTGDGTLRKDYVFTVNGYDDKFIFSVYANDDYDTTEVNAYFLDGVKDAQVFYALHTKYNDTYIATNLDFIKRMYDAKGGDIYEVNDNFEFYKQTQSKWGQRALWDEIFSAIRNGKAKRIVDSVEDAKIDLSKFVYYVRNGVYHICEGGRLVATFPSKKAAEEAGYIIPQMKSKDSTTHDEEVKKYAVKFDRGNTRITETYTSKEKADARYEELVKRKEQNVKKIYDARNIFANETDKEFLKSAIAELKKYERNWSFMTAKERQSIHYEGITGLRQELKFAEDRLKELEMKKNTIDYSFEDKVINYLKSKGFKMSKIRRSTAENALYILFDDDKSVAVNAKQALSSILSHNNIRITYDAYAHAWYIRIQAPYFSSVKRDAIVDVPEDVQKEFEQMLTKNGYTVVSKGKTVFGRLHYQIMNNYEGLRKSEFETEYKRITSKIKEFENKYAKGGRFPITWNFGLTYNGRITAGIDLDKISTKDSVNDDLWQTDVFPENIIKDFERLISNKGYTITNKKSERLGHEYRYEIKSKSTYDKSSANKEIRNIESALVSFQNTYYNAKVKISLSWGGFELAQDNHITGRVGFINFKRHL